MLNSIQFHRKFWLWNWHGKAAVSTRDCAYSAHNVVTEALASKGELDSSPKTPMVSFDIEVLIRQTSISA